MDKIDKHILARLQDDARVTVADLSEQVSLTSSPCWRRVKALEESGVIRGYHAELDPRRLGYDGLKWPFQYGAAKVFNPL